MNQYQVLESKVFHSPYGTGVAIVTGSSRFTLATNIDDLKLRRLPEVPGMCVGVCAHVCVRVWLCRHIVLIDVYHQASRGSLPVGRC